VGFVGCLWVWRCLCYDGLRVFLEIIDCGVLVCFMVGRVLEYFGVGIGVGDRWVFRRLMSCRCYYCLDFNGDGYCCLVDWMVFVSVNVISV
jgi:hypothetical protein